jgi:hypothetical protein
VEIKILRRVRWIVGCTQDTLVDFHTVSHGSEPSFAGLQTPNAFVMDLSTSESNGNAKSNFSWKALFAATASQLTP